MIATALRVIYKYSGTASQHDSNRGSQLSLPFTVAVRSKTGTVFARSKAAIIGSNPTQGMDVYSVCVYSVFVFFYL
jgi:hypothetical protein